jgi:hypothetical protein
MNRATVLIVLGFFCASVHCVMVKNFQAKKAELTKELNKPVGLFSFSSSEERKRQLQQLGYHRYCQMYPYSYPCNNNNNNNYYYNNNNRYQNNNRYPYNNRNRNSNDYYYSNRYPYRYYPTTPAPFPFNLFGK